jgi:hypothetical protein
LVDITAYKKCELTVRRKKELKGIGGRWVVETRAGVVVGGTNYLEDRESKPGTAKLTKLIWTVRGLHHSVQSTK